MYFLGIDGGGTKTDYLLINEKGVYCSHYRTSGIDFLRKGDDLFGELLGEGINKVCSAVSIAVDDIDMSFLGIPGYGDELLADVGKVNTILKQVLGHERYIADNDALAGWAGSLICRPGINIVAGTGSIGFGADARGNKARSGGWGNIVDGDEGSAYWLGCKMVEQFTKQSDGRTPKGLIYTSIQEKYRLNNDFELVGVLNNDIKMQRDEIAKLAMLLYDNAKKGDAASIELFRRAGCELGEIVNSLIGKLDFEGQSEIKLACSGGVFKAGKYISEPLMESIDNARIKLVQPVLSPVAGAAYYALINGLKDDAYKEVVKNLEECDEIMKKVHISR